MVDLSFGVYDIKFNYKYIFSEDGNTAEYKMWTQLSSEEDEKPKTHYFVDDNIL